MNNLDDRIISNIDGPGIYFIEHIDNKTLTLIKDKLKQTVIGVLAYNNSKLVIEIKGCDADEQELVCDLKPFSATFDNTMQRHDFILDSEKFLRCLLGGKSEISRKYIVLIDATLLSQTLEDDNGDLIKLQAI